jgi:hypothetical protein
MTQTDPNSDLPPEAHTPAETPDPPPLPLRQRALLLMVFLIALMLALPFFLIGWGLRGHFHPATESEAATAEDRASTTAPMDASLRQILVESEVLPLPEPLIATDAAPRFPEWRPAVSADQWAAWTEFLQASGAISLGDFSENGTTLQQYLISTENLPPALQPPPPFAGPTVILVLPIAAPEPPVSSP